MKKIIFFISVLTACKAHAFQQTAYPGTTASLAGSGLVWQTTDNAKVEDGVVTSTRCPGEGTNMLYVSNFGFNVPVTATILGILVEVKENENTDVVDKSAVLFDINGSSASSTDKATGLSWPTPLTYVSYGSSTDLWGYTNITPAFVNNPNFGFGISANRNAGGTQIAEIDVVRITVYSTLPTGVLNATILNGRFP